MTRSPSVGRRTHLERPGVDRERPRDITAGGQVERQEPGIHGTADVRQRPAGNVHDRLGSVRRQVQPPDIRAGQVDLALARVDDQGQVVESRGRERQVPRVAAGLEEVPAPGRAGVDRQRPASRADDRRLVGSVATAERPAVARCGVDDQRPAGARDGDRRGPVKGPLVRGDVRGTAASATVDREVRRHGQRPAEQQARGWLRRACPRQR